MAEATRVLIAFLELGFDSGTQRYCTADETVVWAGQNWIGGSRFLSISPKATKTSAEATTWEVAFSAIPVVIVSQALQEPISGRPWRMWLNEYTQGRTFVATLHQDAGLLDTAELQDDEGTLT